MLMSAILQKDIYRVLPDYKNLDVLKT